MFANLEGEASCAAVLTTMQSSYWVERGLYARDLDNKRPLASVTGVCRRCGLTRLGERSWPILEGRG